jgi:hypothetical protein
VEWNFGGILSCFIFIAGLRFLLACVEPVLLKLFKNIFFAILLHSFYQMLNHFTV